MSHWALRGTRAELYSADVVGVSPLTKGLLHVIVGAAKRAVLLAASFVPVSFWLALGLDIHGSTRKMLGARVADPKLQFHAGELAVQEKRGSKESAYDMVVLGGFVEKHLDTDIQRFFLSVQYMVVSHLDPQTGLVWATTAATLAGEHVEVQADGIKIATAAFPAPTDPLLTLLEGGAPVQVGVIAMQPEVRQRHRLSGVATLRGGVVEVAPTSAWFNCPKYIKRVEVVPPPVEADRAAVVTCAARGLEDDEKALVRQSDTFYIGSAEPTAGADASHRGGRPGFCRVSDAADGTTTIEYGEYNGNGTNMTLGNIYAYGRACLLFVEPRSGLLLQLSGSASVEFPEEGGAKLDAGDCYVRLRVEQVCRIDHGKVCTARTLASGDSGDSPYNPPLTGRGAPAAAPGGSPALAQGAAYVLTHCANACADGSTKLFHFEPAAGAAVAGAAVVAQLKARRPGQFVTLTYPGLGGALRSYTIASSPAESAATGGFHLAIKRKPGGLVSTWLHEQAEAKAPFAVRVLGVDGGPMVLAPEERAVLMISAGVGITPMLAHLRAFRDASPPAAGGGAPRPHLALLHCDRSLEQVVALDELHALHASGVLASLELVETRGEPNRRIARAHLARALGTGSPTVLLCGPEQFMYPIKRTLIDDLGLDPGLICFDDFTF